MNLSEIDVGTTGQIKIEHIGRSYPCTVRVTMSITAPRGRMLLLSPLPDNCPDIDRQCKAIRAFMEEHKND